jgi:hypothetical protein
MSRQLPAFDAGSVDLAEAAQRVLRLPGVADKTFLITIGDRSVTGLIARDQMVGPWQVPVADVAVTLAGFETTRGEAFAIGEKAPLALIDAPASGRMAIGEAITYAAREFERCPYPADRRTIDISGDGTNTNGLPAEIGRDRAVAAGITINGLAILSDTPSPWNPNHTHPPGGLDGWYRENVIGGTGAFLLSVMGFETFAFAMVNKLTREST